MLHEQNQAKGLLKLADKIIIALVNNISVVNTTFRKTLHNLLAGSEFDIYESLNLAQNLSPEFISETVKSINKNEVAKKFNVLKSIEDKLNSALKISPEILQEAFQKISEKLQDTLQAEDADYFLELNASHDLIENDSCLSKNKSRTSDLNQSDVGEIQKDFDLFETQHSEKHMSIGRSNKQGVAVAIDEIVQSLSIEKFEIDKQNEINHFLQSLANLISYFIR